MENVVTDLRTQSDEAHFWTAPGHLTMHVQLLAPPQSWQRYQSDRTRMLCFRCKSWVLRETARLRTEGRIRSPDFKKLHDAIVHQKAGENDVKRAKERDVIVRANPIGAAQRAELPPREVKILQ